MGSILNNAQGVIEAAAKSTLGVLALLIIVCSFISLTFFRSASQQVKLGVFAFFGVGTFLFAAAVLVRSDIADKDSSHNQAELEKAVIPGANSPELDSPSAANPTGTPSSTIAAAQTDATIGRGNSSGASGSGPGSMPIRPSLDVSAGLCHDFTIQLSDPKLPYEISEDAKGCPGELLVTLNYEGEAAHKDVGADSGQTSEVRFDLTNLDDGRGLCQDQPRSRDRAFNSFSLHCAARVLISRGHPAAIRLRVYKANISSENVGPLRVTLKFFADS